MLYFFLQAAVHTIQLLGCVSLLSSPYDPADYFPYFSVHISFPLFLVFIQCLLIWVSLTDNGIHRAQGQSIFSTTNKLRY